MATNTYQTYPFYPIDISTVKIKKYLVDAGQTAPEAGQWVVRDNVNTQYVEIPSDGDGSGRPWAGVVAQVIREVSATVDGIYLVYDAGSSAFRGPCTTSTNLADSLRNTVVTLDVSTFKQTVDENDASSGALFIEDFDTYAGTVDVRVDVSSLIND